MHGILAGKTFHAFPLSKYIFGWAPILLHIYIYIYVFFVPPEMSITCMHIVINVGMSYTIYRYTYMHACMQWTFQFFH